MKPAASEWISIEERMPQEGKTVWICYRIIEQPQSLVFGVGYYFEGQWYEHDAEFVEPIHWAYINAPAESSGKEE